MISRGSRVKCYHLGGIARTLGNPGDIVNVDGNIVVGADNQAADIFECLQERAGGDSKTGITGLNTAGLFLAIRGTDGLRHLIQTYFVASQTFGKYFYRNLLGTPPHHKAVTCIRNLFDTLQNILRQHSQLTVVDIVDPVPVQIL